MADKAVYPGYPERWSWGSAVSKVKSLQRLPRPGLPVFPPHFRSQLWADWLNSKAPPLNFSFSRPGELVFKKKKVK